MATFLFVWELGHGLGHMTMLQPIVESLIHKGHCVTVALRDLSKAELFFPECQLLQSPIKLRGSAGQIALPATYVDVLYNTGFRDRDELNSLVRAWQSLIAHVRPDCIVFDHSPTALLASLKFNTKRVLFGVGFCCPPPSPALLPLRRMTLAEIGQAAEIENRVLTNVNSLISSWKAEPLEHVMQLYARPDETILSTFSELDHFGPRPEAKYWGIAVKQEGMDVQWPANGGKKVLAYLKPFPGLPTLLKCLVREGYSTIVLGGPFDPELKRTLAGPTMHFEDRLISLRTIGAECDFAILNGTHVMTTTMLLKGKPLIQFPLYLEGQMTAERVEKFGAGLSVNWSQPDAIELGIAQVAQSESMAECARSFQRRYATESSSDLVERLTDRVLQVAAS
jgi:hypothetical protein